jgi:hypothetical protein
MLAVDGIIYSATELPITFEWDVNSTHDFGWLSPLAVSSEKRYTWGSASGLSASMNGTITIPGSGSLDAAYKTQHAVTIQAGPYGVVNPSGSSGYDSAGHVVVAATPNSGCVFVNWSVVGNISITDPASNSTTLMIQGSGTATAGFRDIKPPSITDLSPAAGGISLGGVAIRASYSDNAAVGRAEGCGKK